MNPVSVYQPIVDLATGTTVAYEALARGPQGEPPVQMFADARATNTLAELDWACRAAAIQGALDADLDPATALFINIEPSVVGRDVPPLNADLHARSRHLGIYLEITERAITDRPAELLALVTRLRALGVGIALDDVGADPRSLALLPVLRPDVIKLDMSLVQDVPTATSALVMNAVCAHAEATGATILAEGIETEKHLLMASTLGATLGQGWYFGRPGPLPARNAHPAGAAWNRISSQQQAPGTPVEIVGQRHPLRVGRKDLLLAVTRRLEAHGRELGKECVLISTFQEARFFTPRMAEVYRDLASEVALVAALGVGLPVEPAPGVRGADIDAADPLRGEWDVAVIAPHFAGALVARDLGDDGPDPLRRFEFVLTFERNTVIDIIGSLLSRVVAVPDAAPWHTEAARPLRSLVA